MNNSDLDPKFVEEFAGLLQRQHDVPIVPLDQCMKWIGYSGKWSAKRTLKQKFESETDYSIKIERTSK